MIQDLFQGDTTLVAGTLRGYRSWGHRLPGYLQSTGVLHTWGAALRRDHLRRPYGGLPVKPCARCDWIPELVDGLDTKAQLREHALDWAHPLCCLCSRSLPDTHPQTCEACLVGTQETLAGILLLWQELPRHLGHAKAQVYDRDGRGGAEEHQLPGGTVLALLAPGGTGTASRYGDDYEPDPRTCPERWWVLGQQGPLTLADWMQAERVRYGTEHHVDNTPADGESVQQTLWSWVQSFADAYREATPNGRRSILTLGGYLQRRGRWAANNHDGYADYASELQKLHVLLEVAVSKVRQPVKAGADCFVCSSPLTRPLREEVVHQTRQARPPAQWWLPGAIGPLPPPPFERIVRTGQVDDQHHVTCAQCGAQYDPARYSLALKAKVEEGSRLEVAGEAYATTALVAGIVDRPEQTIRNWLSRGLLRRQDRRGIVFVNVADAAQESDTRPSRVVTVRDACA